VPKLIEYLADLTGFRDRDQLDVTVVRAVNEVLRPVGVSIFRSVGESENKRWLTRARMGAGDLIPLADPPWTVLSALPALDDAPARRNCLIHNQLLTLGDEHGTQTTFFPISTEKEVIGVLELVTDSVLAQSDRSMVSTVLRMYGNFLDLLDRSERDPLTGLLNRQTFEAAFMIREPQPLIDGAVAAPSRRAVQVEESVWLGVADIDHFKRVNDTYGHPIGDEVLLLMSRLLRSTFRYQDRLYRFGGEEFVVVLECASSEQAAMAFERLRNNVERFTFPQVGRISVSIGFAQARTVDTPLAIFTRADKALYHAKAHGRNQVSSYDDLLRDGVILEAKDVVGDIELF
jgi:diguanylate cyclase (GGDEF)-like protein